ncbi:MAG: aldehyde dehydrogenase family protein, partial [Pleurocapsa sp.]
MKVNNIQDLNTLIKKVKSAQSNYANFNQQQVDNIFKKSALAANEKRIALAKLAVNETGMGVVEDKVIKNHFASEFIYYKYKHEPTCGVIESDSHFGIQKIAEPVGILAGIVPTTNPTSTAIFKALIALKTRNAIIFSPHPRAKECTIAAAKIVHDAAVAAGAPEHLIGWIDKPSVELSQALMQHPNINLILATGGPGMVKAAYSSGKPSLGVGAGNTPAVIDETADIKLAVSSILLSKTFDNGMICASEQSVIVVDEMYDRVKAEFALRGAYFLSLEERQKVSQVLVKDGHINAAIVGQSVADIGKLADIEVPEGSKVIIGEIEGVGVDEPFSIEKLSPILALFRVADFEAATAKAEELILLGGRGHTSVLYTAPSNSDRIDYFDTHVSTGRVLINTPSSQGAIGDLYNFKLDPSLTLGCGTWGGNSVSENVSVHHLLNFKTVSERRQNMLWFRVPPKVYFKYGCLPVALRDLAGKKRAFIVTDKPLYD